MITLLGHTWTPAVPDDAALAFDLSILASNSPGRACAGALIATWGVQRANQRPPINYSEHNYNAGAFGGACFNELIKRGVPLGEVLSQGRVALDALRASIITAEEVEAAEGFSGPSEESTSTP